MSLRGNKNRPSRPLHHQGRSVRTRLLSHFGSKHHTRSEYIQHLNLSRFTRLPRNLSRNESPLSDTSYPLKQKYDCCEMLASEKLLFNKARISDSMSEEVQSCHEQCQSRESCVPRIGFHLLGALLHSTSPFCSVHSPSSNVLSLFDCTQNLNVKRNRMCTEHPNVHMYPNVSVNKSSKCA